MKAIVESLREWFAECPLLDGENINYNFLDLSPVSFTIDDTPTQPIVKRYIDGSSLRQYEFILASSEYYSRDVIESMKASGFYEDLSAWVEERNNNGMYPVIEEGTVQEIECTTNGYCIAADIEQKLQRYQIQCRMLYLQERV